MKAIVFFFLCIFVLNNELLSKEIIFRQLGCKSFLYKDKELKSKTKDFLYRGDIVQVVDWHKISAEVLIKTKKKSFFIHKHHLSLLPDKQKQEKSGNYKIGNEVINKEKTISLFYQPNDLVEVEAEYKGPHVQGHPIFLRKEAYSAFKKMLDDAQKKGLNIKIISGYRSTMYQEKLYRGSIGFKLLTDIALAAKPGHSEHQLGTSADVMVPGKNIRLSKEFKWIKKNARKYGIYISYPKGNTKGYQWEPWHLRYWGKTQFKDYYSD